MSKLIRCADNMMVLNNTDNKKKLFVINKTRFEIYLASVIIAEQFPGSDKSFCKDLS